MINFIIVLYRQWLESLRNEGSYEMVEKVGLVLALCRPGLGLCIYILLPWFNSYLSQRKHNGTSVTSSRSTTS